MSTKNPFSVNPKAESVLNGVATLILVLGWIMAIAGAIAGIAFAVEEDEVAYAFLGIFGGALILIVFYILWAELKVIVNMSRSLYNINDAVYKLKENVISNEKAGAAEKVTDGSATFQVGQLVVIKATEVQFRIDEVRQQGDEVVYYSKKLDKVFGKDEIIDYNKYWADKK